jgi:GT2 family glycosyltransferase
MSEQSITVIIPSYNSAILLSRCLNSVLSQSRKPSQVIVVNDGSTDNTSQILKEYKENYNIEIIEQNNRGPAASRNRGMEIATGQFVAFLDADDYWKYLFLETTGDFLDKHPEAIAVSTGQVHKVPGRKQCILPKFIKEQQNVIAVCVLDNFFEFWAKYNHVCTGSVLMRTEFVKRTGGQREDLRICEDLEFWGYLATFGKWGFIPNVLFVSDGGLVTKKQGWLNKNKKRWASAPTVEDWQKRILTRIAPGDAHSFKIVTARIAKNLAYFCLLAGNESSARSIVDAYGKYFPKDNISRLMKIGASAGTVGWKSSCLTLRFREYIKNISILITG